MLWFQPHCLRGRTRCRWLLVGLFAAAVSCGGSGDAPPSTPTTPTPPTTPPPPAPAVAASVDISGDTSALRVGGTRQLTAAARDASGTVLTGRTVSWSSSAPTVMSVSASGLVTALASGQTTITATVDQATARVTLSAVVPVSAVIVSPDSLVLAPGDAQALSATLRDASGGALTGRTIQWSSTASTIATVSATGTVTAVTTGRALIIATSEARADTAPVQVVTPNPRLVFDRVPTQIKPGFGLGLVVRATRTGLDTMRAFAGSVSLQDTTGANTLLGSATEVLRNGLAVFDDLAFRSTGTYRLRATAPQLASATTPSIVVTATPSLLPLTIGTATRTPISAGVEGVTRYRLPVTLRDAGGAAVGPTPVSIAITRGTAAIRSGATTVGTVNGIATFDLVIQGTRSLDVTVTAPGFEPRTTTLFGPDYQNQSSAMLQRAASDSVVRVGQSISLQAVLLHSALASAPVHAVTFEVSWSTDQLRLVSDSIVVAGVTTTINRTQVGEGILRVSLTGTNVLSAVGQTTLLQRLVFTPLAGASGQQSLAITLLDLFDAAGQPLASRSSFETNFRVP